MTLLEVKTELDEIIKRLSNGTTDEWVSDLNERLGYIANDIRSCKDCGEHFFLSWGKNRSQKQYCEACREKPKYKQQRAATKLAALKGRVRELVAEIEGLQLDSVSVEDQGDE